MNGPETFFAWSGVLVAYLLPAFIASGRKHYQRGSILVLNLFLGWTVIGWIAALMWAASGTRKSEAEA